MELLQVIKLSNNKIELYTQTQKDGLNLLLNKPKKENAEAAQNGPNFINKNYMQQDIHKYSVYLFRVMCDNQAFWLRGHTLGF